ncbi:MAG: AmmeMemoRadiSam system protein B [Acidobacteriota bacterium]
MKTVRPPAVAGRFYPGDPVELSRMLDELALDSRDVAPGKCAALLAPHAGYVYSGLTAARTYARAEIPERSVILCPNHTGRGAPFAIMSRGAWETPLGTLDIDEDLAARLLATSRLLEEDSRAHEHEHALEVQLPFLLRRRSDHRFVPICVGRLDYASLDALGRELASVLAPVDPRPLVIISSDMTHYEPARTAKVKDRKAIDRMEALDARGLHDVVLGEHISMCGIAPATVALRALAGLGARGGTLVDYTTSGDRTLDYEDVVAYAGLTFA